MTRIRISIRAVFLALLGLIGIGLLLEGLWFVWQGGPVEGIVMLLGAGVSLTGCAWWLLFRSPERGNREENAFTIALRNRLQAFRSNAIFLFRDTVLSREVLNLYSVGTLFRDPTFISATRKFGGIQGNTRFVIISDSARSLDLLEVAHPEWDMCLLLNDQCFKVIHVAKSGAKSQIALLHFPDEDRKYFETPEAKEFEALLAPVLSEGFQRALTDQPLPELADEEWQERTSHPLGISPEGTLFPACEASPATSVNGETPIFSLPENQNTSRESEVVSEFDVEGVHFQVLWKPGLCLLRTVEDYGKPDARAYTAADLFLQFYDGSPDYSLGKEDAVTKAPAIALELIREQRQQETLHLETLYTTPEEQKKYPAYQIWQQEAGEETYPVIWASHNAGLYVKVNGLWRVAGFASDRGEAEAKIKKTNSDNILSEVANPFGSA